MPGLGKSGTVRTRALSESMFTGDWLSGMGRLYGAGARLDESVRGGLFLSDRGAGCGSPWPDGLPFPGKGIAMELKMKMLRAIVPALCIACVFGAVFCARPASAQTEVERARVAAEVAKVAGKLPAESQEVITRLTLLGQLPD